jgi:anti-sigma B factor antagonist
MSYNITELGKYKVVHIQGNLQAGDKTKAIIETVSELARQGNHHFVFNLSDLLELDSTGISIFIHCLCDVQENNGSVYLVVSDAKVKEVIELVGLNRLIKLYPSMEAFTAAHVN